MRFARCQQACSGVAFGTGIALFCVYGVKAALYSDCWIEHAECAGLALVLHRTINGSAAFAVFSTLALMSDVFAGRITRSRETCFPQPDEVVERLQAKQPMNGLENIYDARTGNDFCVRCLCWRGPTAHHCAICGRCVPEWDHHCFALGTCIGGSNIPPLRGNQLLFHCHMLNAAVACVTIIAAWVRYAVIKGGYYNPAEMPSAVVFLFQMAEGKSHLWSFCVFFSVFLVLFLLPFALLYVAFECVSYTWVELFARANVKRKES